MVTISWWHALAYSRISSCVNTNIIGCVCRGLKVINVEFVVEHFTRNWFNVVPLIWHEWEWSSWMMFCDKKRSNIKFMGMSSSEQLTVWFEQVSTARTHTLTDAYEHFRSKLIKVGASLYRLNDRNQAENMPFNLRGLRCAAFCVSAHESYRRNLPWS